MSSPGPSSLGVAPAEIAFGSGRQMAFTNRGDGFPRCEVPTPRHPQPRPRHSFLPFLVVQVFTRLAPGGHLQPFQPFGTPLTALCFRLAIDGDSSTGGCT